MTRSFVGMLAFVVALMLLGRGVAAADASSDYAKVLRAASAQLRAIAASSHSARPVRGHQSPWLQIRAVHVSPAPLDSWLQARLVAIARSKPAYQATQLRNTAIALEDAAHLTVDLNSTPNVKSSAPRLNPKRTVLAILADPSYKLNELPRTVEKTWWERFLEWLGGLFDKLFGGAVKAAASAPRLSQLVGFVILALVAGALVFVVFQLARGYLLTKPRRAAENAGEIIGPAANPRTLVSGALEAARDGRYARAIALLFQASLVGLDRAGVVTYDPARTAGEYRRVVKRSRASAAQPFDRLAFAFTYATYAERPTGEREWHDAQSAYEALEPFVRSTPPTGAGA